MRSSAGSRNPCATGRIPPTVAPRDSSDGCHAYASVSESSRQTESFKSKLPVNIASIADQNASACDARRSPFMTTPSTIAPTGTGSLAGRVAVVTGGGRGAGAAIARRLAADGAAVIVAARTPAEIEAVAAGLRATGARASAIVCDVSIPSSIEELAEFGAAAVRGRRHPRQQRRRRHGGAHLVRTTLDEWNTALSVNATSAFLCLKAFLPAMLEAGWGRVVNIASTAALSSDRYIAAYAASKHALLGLTRTAAAEVAAHGVTVNAICPRLSRHRDDRTVAWRASWQPPGDRGKRRWPRLPDATRRIGSSTPKKWPRRSSYLCSDGRRRRQRHDAGDRRRRAAPMTHRAVTRRCHGEFVTHRLHFCMYTTRPPASSR